MTKHAPALPRPEPQSSKAGHGTGAGGTNSVGPSSVGPLSFVGWMPFLFGVAYIPAAHVTTILLLGAGFSLFWSVVCVGLLFPSLLLPTLPTASRRKLVRNAGWARCLFAFPPVVAAVLIIQMAMMTEDLSFQALLTVCATAVCALFCAMLLAFDVSLMDDADTGRGFSQGSPNDRR